MSNVAVLIPCYKRPEYTRKCITSLEDSQAYEDVTFYIVDDNSQDETSKILESTKLPAIIIQNESTIGLRNIVIEFFKFAKDFKYMIKLDNDCVVPKNYINDMVKALETLPVDILSPNVNPSNAAFVYGKDSELGFRPSNTVGGLWAMKTELIDDISFMSHKTDGIRGAYHLLNQIMIQKEPRVGWLDSITVEDIGHWSGEHPEHIKSDEHESYSVEIGRRIAW